MDVKEKIQAAFAFIREAYEGKAEQLLLEEVQFDDAEQCWEITVSFDLPKIHHADAPAIARAIDDMLPKRTRLYTVVELRNDNSIRGMRIREFANA